MAGGGRHVSLKAILFADLVGYSRLVSNSEAATLALVEDCFEIFRAKAPEFEGDIVKTMGDGVLTVFNAPSQAVRYAVAIHKAIAEAQASAQEQARFRIGINMGEVEVAGHDVYGHAVNVAARLVALANPGGVCVSHEVYRQVRRTTSFGFVAGGLTHLKNIPEPIQVFHLSEEDEMPAIGRERLTVQTIDGLAIVTADGESIPMPAGRASALIGYLALADPSGDLYARIATLLWPDQDIKSARRALTNCISVTRTALGRAGPALLIRQGGRIALDVGLIDVDLICITRDLLLGKVADLLIERPDWPEVILLGGENVSRLYRSWLSVARHNWRVKIADALDTCLGRFDAIEPAARRAASALLSLEPSHEPAARKLIEHYVANHNAALAIRTYREFAARLDEQYHIAPGAETLALIDGIMRGRERSVAPAARDNSRPPRVALGVFEGSSAGGPDMHLIPGFRSELLVNLSRFREWIVLESEVGDSAAQADYAVAARYRPEGPGLSFFVTLSEPTTGRVIWGEEFPVSVSTWFQSQRHLVRKIAAHLQIYLSSDRLLRTISQADTYQSIHNDWLKAEHLLTQWTTDAEDEAALIFGRIIARSPDFAPAYASLAGIYNVRHLIRPGSPLDAREERRGLELGRKAVALDPLDSRNHLVLAWSSAMAGAYDQAAAYYDLAASLNPSSPKLLISCAQGMAFVGSPERAAALLSEALTLAPFLLKHQWCYVASTYALIGDYEAGAAAALRGENATVDTPGWRAVCLCHLGRMNEAKLTFAELVDVVTPLWAGPAKPDPGSVRDWFLNSFPIGRESDRATVRRAFEHLDIA